MISFYIIECRLLRTQCEECKTYLNVREDIVLGENVIDKVQLKCIIRLGLRLRVLLGLILGSSFAGRIDVLQYHLLD